MEVTIKEREKALETLEARSILPEVVSSSIELTKIMSEMASVQSEIEKLYERWVELETKQQT